MLTLIHRLLSAAACVCLASVGPAQAAPLSAAQLQAVAPGGEFRGYVTTNRGFENHIWRFGPGGQATATVSITRATGNLGYAEEFGDSGTWRVEGNRLCVEWQGPNRQYSGCYTVDGTAQSSQVRLIGPATWQGTLSR
jgi:hypothetical protein